MPQIVLFEKGWRNPADASFPPITPRYLPHTAASLAISAARMSKPCGWRRRSQRRGR
jgi:hypothetical protein